jgi:hypothetical protein
LKPRHSSSRRLRRIEGVLEHAIEDTIRADPGVAAAGGEPGGELEGAFGHKVI